MHQVARRFARLLARIQPSPTSLVRARGHFTHIRSRLERSFHVSRIALIGSHAKGTAIASFSDVDILAVLRRREARWGAKYVGSDTFLGNVRDDLVARYPATDIRRDKQAAVVNFSGGAVDVVPAVYAHPTVSGHPVYRIPDGGGAWLATAPDIHRRYFLRADARSGGKLRAAVQLIKLWAKARATPLPLSSFHVEMVLADAHIGVGPRPYGRVLTEAFTLLEARAGAALRDPCGVSGLIHAAETEPKRELLRRALDYAAEHAREAYYAERDGDGAEAVRQWRIVFGEYFPLTLPAQ